MLWMRRLAGGVGAFLFYGLVIADALDRIKKIYEAPGTTITLAGALRKVFTDLTPTAWGVLIAGTACIAIATFEWWQPLAIRLHEFWRNNVRQREEKLPSSASNEGHPQFPSAHLDAMQRYEGTLVDLQRRLEALTRLVRQWGKLHAASNAFRASYGAQSNFEELNEISELILSHMSSFAVALPHEPSVGVRIATEWNTYVHIFDVPMRIPPQIRVFELPDGVHAELVEVTRLYFKVRFWPEEKRVVDFSFSASAEL